ncbi:MAG: sterol desaturase family protein [Gammaproteobacteria bacterium]
MMNTPTLLLLASLLSLGRILAIMLVEGFSKTNWAAKRAVYPARPIPHRNQEYFIFCMGILIEAVLLVILLKFSIIHFNATSLWGVVVLLLSFMFIVEPIYYFYHRLLHTKFLYKRFHIHHHRAIVPTPISAFYFTLTERLSYTVLFVLPLFLLSALNLLSIPLLVIFTLSFDIINALGHTNTQLFSENYKKSIWHLFFYSPDFHGDHHKYFRTNYSLFMPLWDKLFKTYRS